MAVYKVPQDVEADDKLIGPFSPRQAMYAGVVAIAIGVVFVLGQQLGMAVGLTALAALLPIILIFGALALPLRKDQPMETYLLALVRFYLKPRDRLWQADGSVALVEITAPKAVEEIRSKGINQDQARNQLDYLAQLMDTRGWAAKGIVQGPMAVSPTIVVPDGDVSRDMFDEGAPIAQNFDQLLDRQSAEQKKSAIAMMQAGATEAPTVTPANDLFSPFGQSRVIEPAAVNPEVPAAVTKPPAIIGGPVIAPIGLPSQLMSESPLAAAPTPAPPVAVPPESGSPKTVTAIPAPKPIEVSPVAAAPAPVQSQALPPNSPANPYSKANRQPDIEFHLQPQPQEVETSIKEASSDTIDLAYNNDLSISAIANEAHRREEQKQGGEDDEVVISLR